MSHRPKVIAGVALAALLAGCGEQAATAPSPAASAAAPTSSAAPSAPATPVAAPDLEADPETVATGLDVPWGLAFLPDGTALLAERDTARVLRVRPGARPEQVLTVPGVEARGEGGLLGLAVSPGYEQDRWVYAYYTAAQDNRIVRFRLDGGGAPEVIFDGIAKAGNHNGGRIAFGPDGMLYAGTGDAARTATSQDRDSPNGKILRLTPDGDPAPGNPVAGSPVYSLGHRNVQGLAWDARGRLFATEFGQNRLDEVNQIDPGANYGWPEVEGTGGGSDYKDPLVTWPTDQASPSGAAIVGDTMYVAGLRGERLWAVPLGGGAPRAHFTGEYGRLRTVEVAPDGALWLTTSNTDGRGDLREGDDRVLRFPAG
ncbi:PQQ-dependent sugar dehydrogenase [Spirilliplanes yamanashiensis]|uniref:Oxidoreductase n=1 Tax=Spirilliplanes yamanashiensis TaxID=42233 RepID=A0A8J4DLD5_9ACTN|nr:PQQ-dependent sugar dehydrogenase [Spirilliplanes yamanashiensis]MDP9818824.1 glucose/arabinose dehydrogenase [Spirilliplanes yamanashiensis]GIJ05278.1 oxidoreductase [Spirilliplanes yamanashiensis]